MEVKLDNWDRKILYELDRDASIGLKKIAVLVGRSKEFVSYRIKRLEKEKVINGYTAIVDMSKLGYLIFRIYLRFQNTCDERVKEIVDYLKEEDRIWTIAQLHGRWDYAFFIGIKNVQDFHEVWKQFLFRFKENINESRIAIYYPVYNFNKRFFMSQRHKVVERVIGTGPLEKVDGLDMKIIRTWGVDVRQTPSEIAKRLKTSPKTISSRIKMLKKKKIIVGCKADIGQDRLGYQGYRVDLCLNSTEKEDELFAYCKNHPSIYQINDSIGGADFEIEMIVKNLQELLEIMNEMMVSFKGSIRNYEYFSFLVFPKLSIVPD